MASAWDQIITDHYLAQLIFQGPSGLPEDQFVTTYVFRNDNVLDRDGMFSAVETALTNFWSDPAADDNDKLVKYIPDNFSGGNIKLFDLGATPPRIPEETGLLSSIVPSGTMAPLPREVAVCLSYHTGGPGPRNRGRIYLGPLTSQALETPAGAAPRVQTSLRTKIVDRATDMATNPSLECTWVLWSRANAATYQIVGGWVDDAFDTQRRRGAAPSSRTSWGAPIVTGGGGPPGGDPATSEV